MKLLLTSAGWWKSPAIGREFIKLVGKKPSEIRIFLVITPIKYLKRNKYILRQFRQFKEFKIPKENITFFKLNRKIKKADLKNIDVIFVFGGEPLEYLSRIRKTGLDKAIKNFVKRGGVYLGLSAGSYVVCPTMEVTAWKHPEVDMAKVKNLKALNLVPFLITAHFEEKWRPVVERPARQTKYEVIALTDKQAILIKDNQRTIIGSGRENVFNKKSE